jgi:hypothetical protein
VSAPLFDVAPTDQRPKLSGDARRAQRQAEAIRRRQHPLAVALQVAIPLHADAPADPLDRQAPGLRCRTCKHREPRGGVAGSYQKCWLPGDGRVRHPRISGGPGTDVRGWFPACTSYEPGAAR